MSKIEEAFRGLGRTEKAKFISQNIDYANADAVAKYVNGYLFDVLNDVGNDEYIAIITGIFQYCYLRSERKMQSRVCGEVQTQNVE